jgi:hypothetical protein
VLSLKPCVEGSNLVKQIMHAPWCITGCSSNIFHQSHMQRTSMGGQQGLVSQENHGGMWGKGAWTWLKAKTSSGRTNNASKGVDERVWAVQPVEHAVTKVTKWRWVCWKKIEPGRARRHLGRSAQAGRPPPYLSTIGAPLRQVSCSSNSLFMCSSL